MLDVRYSTKFKKDFKTCIKLGLDTSLFKKAVDTLRIPAPLPPKNKEHNLSGNYAGYRECHLQPDWLLIYQQTDTELLLHRTGTHSDLFGM